MGGIRKTQGEARGRSDHREHDGGTAPALAPAPHEIEGQEGSAVADDRDAHRHHQGAALLAAD